MDKGDKMSALKHDVTKILHSNGVLAKLKAQLRAAVFTAIYDSEKDGDDSRLDKKGGPLGNNEDAKAAAALVVDFLRAYGLDNTLSVLLPELQIELEDLPPNENLALNMDIQRNDSSKPILVSLVQKINSGQSVTSASASASIRSGRDAFAQNIIKSQKSDDEDNEAELTSTMKRIPKKSPEELPSVVAPRQSLSSSGLPSLSKPRAPAPQIPSDDEEDDDRDVRIPSKNLKPSESDSKTKVDESHDSDNDSVDNDIKRLQEVHTMISQHKMQGRQGRLALLPSRNTAAKLASTLHHQSDEDDDDENDDTIQDENISVEDDTSPVASPAIRLSSAQGPESVSFSNLSMSDRSVDGSMALDEFDHVEEIQR